jgi:hypothetical protein
MKRRARSNHSPAFKAKVVLPNYLEKPLSLRSQQLILKRCMQKLVN